MSTCCIAWPLPPAAPSPTKAKRTITTLGAPAVGKSTLTAALANGRHRSSPAKHRLARNHCRHAVVAYETRQYCCTHYDGPSYSSADDKRHRRLAQVDAAILVLDVQLELTAQCNDLLRLARQQGLPLIVPFLNKCDRVTPHMLPDALEEMVEALLDDHGFPPITPIWGAALPALAASPSPWHECLEQLLLHLDYHLTPPRLSALPPWDASPPG